MSWNRRIQRVTDHVRTHLRDDLSAAELARVAHASPFHFGRMVKAVTGETPAGFVQRARLERATTVMKTNPGRPLTDVALGAGFSSLSDFSRVFRQRHGIPPSRWDRTSRLPDDGIEGYDEALGEAARACPPQEVRVVRHPACRVAYVRVPTPFLGEDVLQEGYEALIGWFDGRGVDWRALPLLGWSWDHPEATPLHQVRFDLGFVLPDGLAASGDLTEQAFPEVTALDVRVQGGLPCIAIAWERIYEHLRRTDREPRDLPGTKRFRRRPDELGWSVFDLDCSIAVSGSAL